MASFRTILKSGFAAILLATGIIPLLIRVRLKGRCIVLTYHRVVPESKFELVHSHPGIVVSEKVFDLHMRTLKKWMTPISLTTFLKHVKNGSDFPDGSCLVTFDDGWLDNYEAAFPILEKYGVPAVVFLPVDYISSDKIFWQEEMTMLIESIVAVGDRGRLAELAEILQTNHELTNMRKSDLRKIAMKFKSSSDEVVARVIVRLQALCGGRGDSDHYNRHLSWSQVAEMRGAGIEFGSHARTHSILTQLSSENSLKELSESKRIMEQRLGQPVDTLAYPNGDFDSEVIENARKSGYKVAFATVPDYCQADSSSMTLPRINIHNGNSRTAAQFLATIITKR